MLIYTHRKEGERSILGSFVKLDIRIRSGRAIGILDCGWKILPVLYILPSMSLTEQVKCGIVCKIAINHRTKKITKLLFEIWVFDINNISRSRPLGRSKCDVVLVFLLPRRILTRRISLIMMAPLKVYLRKQTTYFPHISFFPREFTRTTTQPTRILRLLSLRLPLL